MAINIRCYTKLAVSELQHHLDRFLSRNPSVFPQHYILYRARALGPFDKEISNEFGLDPESYFYLAVNNKALEISTDTIADMVRKELGKENVIVLLNGEDLI
ncbi:hypothetical protein [Erwinia sorbitola]|uniref:Uncharacterized protein n=1 Tax=Erwinia sorbitola TaxID=2681984 RepID=A0ABW9RGA3_9GAMM|nr:hypothetical protein [Erwinia sorbitola]MTD29003.1 hypothetical protein [Erwinia sorbitola]